MVLFHHVPSCSDPGRGGSNKTGEGSCMLLGSRLLAHHPEPFLDHSASGSGLPPS